MSHLDDKKKEGEDELYILCRCLWIFFSFDRCTGEDKNDVSCGDELEDANRTSQRFPCSSVSLCPSGRFKHIAGGRASLLWAVLKKYPFTKFNHHLLLFRSIHKENIISPFFENLNFRSNNLEFTDIFVRPSVNYNIYSSQSSNISSSSEHFLSASSLARGWIMCARVSNMVISRAARVRPKKN